jgi:hypothetical protein
MHVLEELAQDQRRDKRTIEIAMRALLPATPGGNPFAKARADKFFLSAFSR